MGVLRKVGKPDFPFPMGMGKNFPRTRAPVGFACHYSISPFIIIPMSKRILIVDDEEQLCVSLSRLLKASGYDPVYTTVPEMALSLLKEQPADLVITDLKMPGFSELI